MLPDGEEVNKLIRVINKLTFRKQKCGNKQKHLQKNEESLQTSAKLSDRYMN